MGDCILIDYYIKSKNGVRQWSLTGTHFGPAAVDKDGFASDEGTRGRGSKKSDSSGDFIDASCGSH